MTNDKLCNIIGTIGCLITGWHMGLMFFGFMSAAWGAGIGLLVILFGLFNYE
jgi:hypothetical protein